MHSPQIIPQQISPDELQTIKVRKDIESSMRPSCLKFSETGSGGSITQKITDVVFPVRVDRENESWLDELVGYMIKLLWLTRDGPPLVFCSPFRPGQPPRTSL